MTPGHDCCSVTSRLPMLDAASAICHASLRSFTSLEKDICFPVETRLAASPAVSKADGASRLCEQKTSQSSARRQPLDRTHFFSTWTLMPLRTALALKHNHKADPQFPTTEKNGQTVTQNLKWRIWSERQRTS